MKVWQYLIPTSTWEVDGGCVHLGSILEDELRQV
jgi:hypothetical protein